MQETEIDPVNVIYKIQKLMNELMESNGQVILGGGVDNMEKYNYILGKIHVLDQIKQEISNLLQPKEPEPDDDKVTRLRR
jgi:hypothetical protein|tara:strand:+ start:569 stop:808 length:240 start_codon:yes stop_codon:yes gene_type:complete